MLTQNRQKISLAALAASLMAMAAAMPAHADALPGAGLSVCLSLDKMQAFREGELKLWRKAAADLGIKLVEQVAGEDAQRQSSQIDTCIAQKVNGIVAIPWDNQAVLQDIERAHAAGIPFVGWHATIEPGPDPATGMFANVTLATVEVPADAMLGAVDAGADVLDAILDRARIGLSAEMLGSAAEAFERTVQYLKERKQFGVPIGSFQALKHRAAEMFCELELTRSAVLAALVALDEGANDTAQLASLAKAKAADTFFLVGNEGVQMHGGIGMTDEHEIGFFLKRARVAQASFGDAPFQRDRYARLLGF